MGKRDVTEEIWIRETAVKVCINNGDTPFIRKVIAKELGVTPQTIRRWVKRVREGKPVYRSPGPKPKDVPRQRRQAVIGSLVRLGPFAGVAVLRGLFESVPYRRLAQLKRRFVCVLKRRYRWYSKRLEWLRAGAVWAADFTKPKARLEHGMKQLLLVRDLASGAMLAAVRCRTENARVAGGALLALFVSLGAPLVLKLDNGSAFVAGATQALLAEYGVMPLHSPPRTPQYNGSCERAGGCYKQRVAHEALLRGHPGVWTDRDLQGALLLANATARPRGARGHTPAQALLARKRVTRAERYAFARTRRAHVAAGLKQFRKEGGRMPTCSQRAAIDRKATQQSLQEHGHLQFRRGRLSTLVSTWKRMANA